MSPSWIFICCLGSLILAQTIAKELPLIDDIGQGNFEEIPIAWFNLFQSEPKFINNEPRNFDFGDDDAEETGEGSIELMPINSFKVRFNPPVQRKRPVVVQPVQSDEICEIKCQLPGLPIAMTRAAKNCNSELVLESSNLLSNRNRREGRENGRRLDTAHRTLCGSKCVLQRLNLLQSNGLPDTDKVTGYFLRSFGFTWTDSLRKANQICSKEMQPNRSNEVVGSKKEVYCEEAANLMRCIRETMTQACPDHHKTTECRKKK